MTIINSDLPYDRQAEDARRRKIIAQDFAIPPEHLSSQTIAWWTNRHLYPNARFDPVFKIDWTKAQPPEEEVLIFAQERTQLIFNRLADYIQEGLRFSNIVESNGHVLRLDPYKEGKAVIYTSVLGLALIGKLENPLLACKEFRREWEMNVDYCLVQPFLDLLQLPYMLATVVNDWYNGSAYIAFTAEQLIEMLRTNTLRCSF